MSLINLPDLVMDIILINLSFNDLNNLSQTCKKLKKIIENKKIDKLFIFLKNNPYLVRIFNNSELIFYRNSLKINNLKSFENLNFKNKFKNLSKLAIIYHCEYINNSKTYHKLNKYKNFNNQIIINLDHLNYFENLEYLEIRKIVKLKGEKLKLKKLKFFFIDIKFESNFQLDCALLESLAIHGLAKPRLINNQDKLTELSIEYCENYLEKINLKIQNLITIKIFECEYTIGEIIWRFIENKLSFPLLKFIKFEGYISIYHLSEMHQFLSYWQNFKIFLKSKEIKFFLNNNEISEEFIELIQYCNQFHLNNKKNYPEYFNEEESSNEYIFQYSNPHFFQKNFNFYCSEESDKNYEFLFTGLKFISLTKELILNELLIFKLRNIKELFIDFATIDKSCIDLILNNFKFLYSLCIFNDSEKNLDQNFFDKLPNCLPNLIDFYIGKLGKLDNFNFIKNFFNLVRLKIDCIDRKDAALILNNSVNLEEIIFIVHYKKDIRRLVIRKTKKKNYLYGKKEIIQFKIYTISCTNKSILKKRKFNNIENVINYACSFEF